MCDWLFRVYNEYNQSRNSPLPYLLFVPCAQTQAGVGDAKPASPETRGFGFFVPFTPLFKPP
jgi:hypothetical protein